MVFFCHLRNVSKIQLEVDMATINCKGKLIDIMQPKVMGIINATNDSFYKGFLAEGLDKMLDIAENMLDEGATFIDVGGQSTRPESEKLTAEQELENVLPFIKALLQKRPDTLISIDTYYATVAKTAVENGACMVNDISGGDMDKAMLQTVAYLKVPYVAMHMQGTPQSMQQNPTYENVTRDLLDYFIAKIEDCKHAGILDVIIDPGFGFGKTAAHNFELLKNLQLFEILDAPVLVGLSRKSMIYKTLTTTAEKALNGTTVLHTLAIQNKANILRVHDVKEAIEVIKLMQEYDEAN